MNDQYFVGISHHYKKAHILLSESIEESFFKTLCGKQLGENIHLINPHDVEICKSCQEAVVHRQSEKGIH